VSSVEPWWAGLYARVFDRLRLTALFISPLKHVILRDEGSVLQLKSSITDASLRSV